MSAQPLISIITPSFNQAAFLEQTILSVLGQQGVSLEYLVVDGASSDGSVEIIRRHASRLAWWISEPDAGQAQALNKGLQRATGGIVAWLNSDDFYLPGALQTAVNFFQQHPEVGLLHGDVLAVNAAGEPLNRIRYGDWGLPGLMEFRIIGQPAVFFRRSLLERSGLLDLSYHYLLDHQLWLRIAQNAPMHYLPQPLAAARYHEQAKNIAHPLEFTQEIHLIAGWLETQPALAELLAANRRRIRSGMHSLSAFYLLEAGAPAQAIKEYGRALLAHPLPPLRSWRRVVSALLALAGLGRLRRLYLASRRRKIHLD